MAALGPLEIGMIALGFFVVLCIAAICAVYFRAREQQSRNDAVEMLPAPKTRTTAADIRALRVNNHGLPSLVGHSPFATKKRTGGRMSPSRKPNGRRGGDSTALLSGTAASLNSLVSERTDAEKMAALLEMRALCDEGQEAEWDHMRIPAVPPSRQATTTPAPYTAPKKKGRRTSKPRIVFSDLDDDVDHDDKDELLLELNDNMAPDPEFPGFGVDRDAGKSIFDRMGSPTHDYESSSSGGFSDSDFESDRTPTPTTLI
mmetsp:Transcript_4463/g.11348  ORF Transcript_4463/g.11348 Transcript_4463/m.11348 type:complete len:259 (-) Transcript_4463:344-1120(-)